jgi:hypothetical protein
LKNKRFVDGAYITFWLPGDATVSSSPSSPTVRGATSRKRTLPASLSRYS